MERQEKVVLTLDSYEHGIMIRALNELRNDMLEEQRDPGPVEDVLLKTIDAPRRRGLHSLVSPAGGQKLDRSAAPPLPTKPCGFAGTPTMAACFSVGTQMRCFPCRGIPFRTVIRFSRCSSSMNYPKSTPK